MIVGWEFILSDDFFDFMEVKEVELNGDFVRLVPLKMEHLDALCEFAIDEKIWEFYPFFIKSLEDLRDYIEDSIRQKDLGNDLPFVTIDKKSDEIVGSTRFMNISRDNRRVEIGSTWINPKWQKTYINTEAKLLMIAHAFEVWKCIRVELKTYSLNEKSRRAILRLGAKEEGTLRNHMIMESGRIRDTVYYSIIDSEWQNAKAALEAKLRS